MIEIYAAVESIAGKLEELHQDMKEDPAGAYGSLGLEAPEPDSMIPFDNLTKEIVVGGVKDKFGDEKVAEIKAALESQILEQRSPSKASGLPWS